MDTPHLLVSSHGPLTRLTINRPQARNSLTLPLITDLTMALRAIPGDGSTRVVLLRGAGEEAFCAGADLSDLLKHPTPEQRNELFGSVAGLIAAVSECPVPVVALVYGFALAGGCGLAAAADIVLASDDAVFGLPEVAVGLGPLVVAAPLLRTIGFRALSELALSGERINAHRALQIGLATRVVARADLEKEGAALCTTLCSRSPAALRTTKRALAALQSITTNQLATLAAESAALSLGPEACEGLTAFAEKRPPLWKV